METANECINQFVFVLGNLVMLHTQKENHGFIYFRLIFFTCSDSCVQILKGGNKAPPAGSTKTAKLDNYMDTISLTNEALELLF